jgi:hypothetical protein
MGAWCAVIALYLTENCDLLQLSGLAADRKDNGEGCHVGSVEPNQSVMGIVQAVLGGGEFEPDV